MSELRKYAASGAIVICITHDRSVLRSDDEVASFAKAHHDVYCLPPWCLVYRWNRPDNLQRWLITMASMHPPILTLMVAIVLVRFFGIFAL